MTHPIPAPRHLFLDLDGTLVDSCPGILASLEQALHAKGLTPRFPLTSAIVGPPLEVMIARITGLEEAATHRALGADFKAHYDQEGFRLSAPYPGVLETLPRLARRYTLRVVTNKRPGPTHGILEHLGILSCFAGVHCVEPDHPECKSKSALLRSLMKTEHLEAREAWFIGDSRDDASAAQEHGLRFVFAAYGYGDAPEPSPSDMLTLHAFPELLDLLERADHAQFPG